MTSRENDLYNLFFVFYFNLCKYLRMHGLKVVNITEFLILILRL